MEKLKIGYFGDGPWSHKAFEKMIKDNTLIVEFIVPRTNSTDDTLYRYSQKYGIPYHKGIKVNSDEFYLLAKSYDCDLFVSMSFNQIFKNRIINLPKYKTINCHAGKLPFYRGRNVLNWVIINDEKEFGITVHFVDEGIDTGDIILQKTYEITDNDDYNSLLQRAYIECADILYDSLKLIQQGNVKPVQQSTIHPTGFYCGGRMDGDEILNWNQTSREVFNFVRAICTPGPNARSYVNNEEIKIKKIRLIENVPKYVGIPGQVLSKSKDGFFIKTLDSFVEVIDYEGKIKVGDRLKTNTDK